MNQQSCSYLFNIIGRLRKTHPLLCKHLFNDCVKKSPTAICLNSIRSANSFEITQSDEMSPKMFRVGDLFGHFVKTDGSHFDRNYANLITLPPHGIRQIVPFLASLCVTPVVLSSHRVTYSRSDLKAGILF